MADRTAHTRRSNDLIFSRFDALCTQQGHSAVYQSLEFIVCKVQHLPASATGFRHVIILHLFIFPCHNDYNKKVDTLNALGKVGMTISKHGMLVQFNITNLGVHNSWVASFYAAV